MFCDLHTHSVFSDGTYTPTELIREADERGLSAIALTDHNTARGLPEFLAAAKAAAVQAVAGVEFSVDWGEKNTELHILGLFLTPDAFLRVEEWVQTLRRNKEESNRILCGRLAAAGYEIDLDEVKKNSPAEFVNRALIGEVLAKKGYVPSIAAAFETLLKKGGEFYVEPKRLPALETVAFIKELGGAAVLAHPFLNLDEEGLRGFLPRAKEAGLDGMETMYSTYTEKESALSAAIAKEFSLKQSGGSDFHGTRKPNIFLGVGKGNLKIPTNFYEELKG
ncbi:MAG: PHP domain-containing protein [Clostridia bacterium]|nr:PHP domain-containing protein [Clostridia bacterium]